MAKTNTIVRDMRVEVEVTPRWWSRLGAKQLGQESTREADMIARSMLLAVGAFTTCEVRVSRNALKLILFVPPDITFAQLSEKAGQLTDRMNELECE